MEQSRFNRPVVNIKQLMVDVMIPALFTIIILLCLGQMSLLVIENLQHQPPQMENSFYISAFAS